MHNEIVYVLCLRNKVICKWTWLERNISAATESILEERRILIGKIWKDTETHRQQGRTGTGRDLVVLLESGVLGGERLPGGVGLALGRGVIGPALLGLVLPYVLPALLEVPPLRPAALAPAAHCRRAPISPVAPNPGGGGCGAVPKGLSLDGRFHFPIPSFRGFKPSHHAPVEPV